jgi:hypothetical protein
MMKTSLFSLTWVIALTAFAQKTPSLDTVRDLIAGKKTGEAVAILKTDSGRLLKTEKNYKDVTRWLSMFLYEDSMALYQKAEELAATDAAGALEQFEALLEKEPYNKEAITAYLSFLIDQKKFSEAKKQTDKASENFPYFGIFQVFKVLIAQAQDEAATLSTCDKRTMTAVETELCHYAQLRGKVAVKDPKRKPTEQELKNLAGKTTIPDASYWLWKATQNETYLKRYVSLCRGLTEKYKKNYRIVPGLCAKMPEAENLLEPKQNDEPNAS